MYIQKLDDPKTIRRVCITHNVFSLLQYLLISTTEEIKHTFFFFTDGKFSRHFPNSMVFNIKRRGFGRGKYLQGYIFLLRRNKLWPFLKHAEFYAQDNGVQDWSHRGCCRCCSRSFFLSPCIFRTNCPLVWVVALTHYFYEIFQFCF